MPQMSTSGRRHTCCHIRMAWCPPQEAHLHLDTAPSSGQLDLEVTPITPPEPDPRSGSPVVCSQGSVEWLSKASLYWPVRSVSHDEKDTNGRTGLH